MTAPAPIGKTRTQGWEIGVRRTFPINPQIAWNLLMTQPGLGFWLGHPVDPHFAKGATITTAEGLTGEIRGYTIGSLIRLTWQPPGADHPSTLQIRVLPARTGTTISFHHERLDDAAHRQTMQQHWSAVLDHLARLIENR